MKIRTVTEAAILALNKRGKPSSFKEIYNTIIEYDLYRFNSEDPENIVKVAIRRHCEGVEFPSAKPNKLFKKLLNGSYWIIDKNIPGQNILVENANPSVRRDSDNLKNIVSELKTIHLKHFDAFKRQLLNQLKEVPPKTFEIFAKKLLEVYGFQEVNVTSYTKDGGLDGYGKLKVGITYLNVAFQCKRWKTTSLSKIEIDKFRGAIQGMYEQGIIFTTSSFSKNALTVTRRSGAVPIILIDGQTLVNIMIEKNLASTQKICLYMSIHLKRYLMKNK